MPNSAPSLTPFNLHQASMGIFRLFDTQSNGKINIGLNEVNARKERGRKNYCAPDDVPIY